MKNPWTKKNPLLSMWMSAANAAAGAARGRATAHAKRQAATWMTQGIKETTRWWADALGASPPRSKPRERKKRR